MVNMSSEHFSIVKFAENTNTDLIRKKKDECMKKMNLLSFKTKVDEPI